MNKWMFVLLLFLLPLNLSAFPYVCVIEKSIGYKLDEKTGNWIITEFKFDNIKDRNFSIKKSEMTKYIAQIHRFGESFPNAGCVQTTEDIPFRNWLTCVGLAEKSLNIRVNMDNLEFIISDFGGYGVEPEWAYFDYANLKIGSCSPL